LHNNQGRGFYHCTIKRLLAIAKQHHGNFTPPRVSPSCPHLLRRFYHARLYGWTGVSLSLIACYRRTGCNPVFIAGISCSLQCKLVSCKSWQLAAKVASRFAVAMGICLISPILIFQRTIEPYLIFHCSIYKCLFIFYRHFRTITLANC
jgi:hypothetical protein